MDLRDLSNLYQRKLIEFFASSEGYDEESVARNANFVAYFFTELSKRWAERRYHQKRTGNEMSIEEAEEKSLEATMRFFRSQDRKRAPANLATSISDADELFDFLGQGQPKAEGEPEAKDEEPGDDNEPKEAVEEVASEPGDPAEEQPPASSFGGAAPGNDGLDHYAPISPEEFKQIRKN